MVVGDSLTVGEHASARRGSFPSLVLESLRAASRRKLSARVVGLSGGRAADLLRLTPPGARRLAIIEVGTNDWLGYRPEGAWSATPAGEFQATYGRLLDLVRASGEPLLISLGIWGPTGGTSEVGGSVTELDEVIASESAARGGRFVPLTAIHDDPGMRGPAGRRTALGISDDFHPNDRGHAAIARMVAAAAENG